MKEYQDFLSTILEEGIWQENRTQYRTLSTTGLSIRLDLTKGFPAVTTKKLPFKAALGELCAFLRSSSSAKQFRELGCNVWDQNANENAQWLANPFRKGEDDLGDIYGVQWRQWPGFKLLNENAPLYLVEKIKADGWEEVGDYEFADQRRVFYKSIDMLGDCIRKIILEPDDRRILFHAWNPAKLDEMALPPCHLLYQFHPVKSTREISMTLYIR